MVAGVHPACGFIEQPRQFIGVGGFKLGKATVLHDDLGQRVIQRQLFQHPFSGGGRAFRRFLEYRNLLLFKQNLPQLLGRAQVEFTPGELKGLALQFANTLFQLLALFVKALGVHGHAVTLNAREHLDQRQLDMIQHFRQAPFVFDLRAQGLLQS